MDGERLTAAAADAEERGRRWMMDGSQRWSPGWWRYMPMALETNDPCHVCVACGIIYAPCNAHALLLSADDPFIRTEYFYFWLYDEVFV